MTKFNLIALTLLLACTSSVTATTVAFSSFGAKTVTNEAGTTLTTGGSLVWVGTFSSTSFTLNNSLSLADNITAIQAAGGWEQFGFDTTTGLANAGTSNSVALNGTGKIAGTVVDTNGGATKADFFNGKQVYVWVFNGSSLGSSTEMGIFTASSATTPWLFPTNGSIPDNVSLATSDASTTMIAVGGVGSVASGFLRTEGITAVPEPSRALLAAMGLFAGLVRRRRK